MPPNTAPKWALREDIISNITIGDLWNNLKRSRRATPGAQQKWQCFSQEEQFVLLCKANTVRPTNQQWCGNERLMWVQETIVYAERRLFLWLRGCLGLSWGSNSNCAMDYRQVCQTAQANSEHLIEQQFLPVSLSLFIFSFSLLYLHPSPYSICPFPFGVSDACCPHKRLISIKGSPHSMLLIYSFIKWVIISYG